MQHLAYKQAGLFGTWLRDGNPESFARMMTKIIQDQQFAEALEASHPAGLPVVALSGKPSVTGAVKPCQQRLPKRRDTLIL
jgi:hypothetical protein